jgi:hypothetical protein
MVEVEGRCATGEEDEGWRRAAWRGASPELRAREHSGLMEVEGGSTGEEDPGAPPGRRTKGGGGRQRGPCGRAGEERGRCAVGEEEGRHHSVGPAVVPARTDPTWLGRRQRALMRAAGMESHERMNKAR